MRKRSIYILWQVLVILPSLFLVSCIKEKKWNQEWEEDIEQVEIYLNVSSILNEIPSIRSEEDVHDFVNNLTLFIFNSEDNSLEFSEYLDFSDFSISEDVDISRWNEERIIMISHSIFLENLDAERDIHVLVNTEDLSGLTLAELRGKLTFPIDGKIMYEEEDCYTMHGAVSNHSFSMQGRALINLKRNVARVDLTINTQNFLEGESGVSFLPNNSDVWMFVKNVADRTFLVSGQEKLPEGVVYISYPGEEISSIYRVGEETSSFTSFYINENILPDSHPVSEDSVTSVVLRVAYCIEKTGQVYENNYYKILISKSSPYRVKRNTIYKLTVDIKALGGETDLTAPILDGKLEVIDWNELNLPSEWDQTYLTVESTSVRMQREWNFNYSSNTLINPLVAASGNWLSAEVISENNILLLADDGEFYSAPRTTEFFIEANHLRKKITVTQEAILTDGSIRLDKDTLYLYEDRVTETVNLEVQPLEARWKELSGNEYVAKWLSSTGETRGDAVLTFEQGEEYSNSNFQFLNIESLEYDNLFVGNLFLSGPQDTIRVPASRGTFVEGDITALGGNFTWKVLSTPNWITSTQVNEDNDLVLVADVDENLEHYEREGVITIAHVNEENYVKEINVKQSSNYVPLPEFDYLVINCRHIALVEGEKRDLDIAVEFVGTGVGEIDYMAVGYGMASENVTQLSDIRARSSLYYMEEGSNYRLLNHTSDGQERGFESAVAYMDIFNNPERSLYDMIPRYVYLDVYANWYNSVDNRKSVNVEMTLYKGGTVRYDGNLKEYVNPDAISSYEEILENIVVYRGSSSTAPFGLACLDHRNAYTYLATVKYDKINRTATLIRRAP